MAKSYQVLYKCRLCGQVFVNCGTVSKKVAEQSTLNEVLRASGMSPMWKRTTRSPCMKCTTAQMAAMAFRTLLGAERWMKMAEEKKIIRLADVGELEADLKKDLAEEEAKGKAADVLYCESISDELSDLGNLPTIDPKTLRPVAHWEEIPGSYEVCAGKSGSWSVPATRCANPECGEANPCGLKTPFCPMCGFRMEDVPYDG